MLRIGPLRALLRVARRRSAPATAARRLEPIRPGPADGEADREGVNEVAVRQFARGRCEGHAEPVTFATEFPSENRYRLVFQFKH